MNLEVHDSIFQWEGMDVLVLSRCSFLGGLYRAHVGRPVEHTANRDKQRLVDFLFADIAIGARVQGAPHVVRILCGCPVFFPVFFLFFTEPRVFLKYPGGLQLALAK